MTSNFENEAIIEQDTRLPNEGQSSIGFPNSGVSVTSPIIKEGIKNYVLYTVLTPKNQKELFRRYSDFHALRIKFTERWPGLYIPNIPPKKAVGNLESNFINTRCKLLNTFLNKVFQLDYLIGSEELKFFVSNTDDVDKSLGYLPKLSFDEALMRYKSVVNVAAVSDVSEAKSRISQFLSKVLNKTKTTLGNFREVLKSTMEKKNQEIQNYLNLVSVFSDYEKQTLHEYSGDDDKLVFFNPKNNELCLKLLKLVIPLT